MHFSALPIVFVGHAMRAQSRWVQPARQFIRPMTKSCRDLKCLASAEYYAHQIVMQTIHLKYNLFGWPTKY